MMWIGTGGDVGGSMVDWWLGFSAFTTVVWVEFPVRELTSATLTHASALSVWGGLRQKEHRVKKKEKCLYSKTKKRFPFVFLSIECVP